MSAAGGRQADSPLSSAADRLLLDWAPVSAGPKLFPFEAGGRGEQGCCSVEDGPRKARLSALQRGETAEEWLLPEAADRPD